MTHLEAVAVRLCVIEALGGDWFNITGVTKACDVLGIVKDWNGRDWCVMRALHCKEWKSMDMEAKSELVAIVARVLGIEPSADVLAPIAITAGA